jgi:hypothetical protein
VLKAKNGVAVAEQLAPYTTVQGKNEDWVLPILVRFNGACDVSESGHIIYNFPSFQQKVLESAGDYNKVVDINAMPARTEELHALFKKHIESQQASHNHQVAHSHLETHLKEKPWELSHVKGGTRTTIICLATFVLLGSLWLLTMAVAMPFLLLLSPLILAMAAYGAMFLVIPAIRSLVIKRLNTNIEARNSARFSAASRLLNPDPDLRRKLSEAEQARRLALQRSSSEEVAYTTDKDLLDQQFENKNLDGNKPSAGTIQENTPNTKEQSTEQGTILPKQDEPSESISTKKDNLEEIKLENT